MKKRILAAVLASASILGAVAGCSSKQRYKLNSF